MNFFVLIPEHKKHPEKCPSAGKGKSPKWDLCPFVGIKVVV